MLNDIQNGINVVLREINPINTPSYLHNLEYIFYNRLLGDLKKVTGGKLPDASLINSTDNQVNMNQLINEYIGQ